MAVELDPAPVDGDRKRSGHRWLAMFVVIDPCLESRYGFGRGAVRSLSVTRARVSWMQPRMSRSSGMMDRDHAHGRSGQTSLGGHRLNNDRSVIQE